MGAMGAPAKLVRLTVVQNATRDKIAVEKTWATVRKDADPAQKGAEFVTIEATTAPKNNVDEWKQIRWSEGAGKPVAGQLNRRMLDRTTSTVYNVKASLGDGTDSIAVWVVWASIEIRTKDSRPTNAAPFDPGTRDESDKLGPVSYKVPMVTSVVDEDKGEFADTMGASGKVAPVATLTPKGVGKVIAVGWAFRRQVWSHNWSDGVLTKQSNTTWANDFSNPKYLKLVPDSDDRIYDLDAPDIRWGLRSYETYNNFRQWIEWNGEKCSDYAPWHWQARWHLDKDTTRQITLNEVSAGNIILPPKPFYPPPKPK